MSELFMRIIKCQSGDEESTKKLCEKFLPIIKKYSNKLYYEEDSLNYMILAFLECIHKIPLYCEKFNENDGVILSYIEKSMYNSYLRYIKKYIDNEKFYQGEDKEYILYNNCITTDKYIINMNILIGDMKKNLSDKEYKLFNDKFLNDLKEVEIAEEYGITKQAVNKQVKKLIKKIRKFYGVD